MQDTIKQQFDSQFNQCKTDDERKDYLVGLGEMAIMKCHMEIAKILILPLSAEQQILQIKKMVAKASEIIAYVNDTMIFNGFTGVEGYTTK